jgi:hypothetical protein
MKKFRNIAMLMVGMTALVGCSDLNEKVLDEYNAAGLTDKQAADGMIAPVYAVLPTIFQHTTLFESIYRCTNMKRQVRIRMFEIHGMQYLRESLVRLRRLIR